MVPITNVIWGKKDFPNSKDCLDLQDIYNFWRIFSLEELQNFLKLDTKYSFYQNKIQNILYSYKNISIDISKYDIKDLVPTYLYNDFLIEKQKIIENAFNWIKEKKYFPKLEEFFIKNANTNIIKYFNFKLNTTNGLQKVDLLYAANFRFKASPGTLNIFHMPTIERRQIIPQNNNSFLYMADFKQFEFRTFLKIHPNSPYDLNEEKIYEKIAIDLKTNEKDAKNQAISYIYGQENQKLDKILNRRAILDLINDEYFEWNGLPVVITNKDDKKSIHTIIQTISQYYILSILDKTISLLKKLDSALLYPFHDELIFSINRSEEWVLDEIKNTISNETYKIHEYVGENLYDRQRRFD